MTAAGYQVKTHVFEGPLDLLLDLVSKRQLFINDISLAQVTDDFIAYIERHDDFPISESAEFIVVASTLMLLKSRSLLPDLLLTEEEEESIEDLEKRLALYAKFRELGAELKKIFGRQIIFEKTPSRNPVIVFSPDWQTTIANLQLALERLIESLPKKEPVPKATINKIMTLEETIAKLVERMSMGASMSFKDFYHKSLGVKGKLTYEKKVSIIVGFLALLELIKRGAIRVTQEERGEIEIELEEVTVPNYSS